MRHAIIVFSCALAAAVGYGCGGGDGPPKDDASAAASFTPIAAAPKSGAPVSEAAAKELFATRCGSCHGASGKGDGPGAAALTPKPRDYTDKEWQKSVTDDQIAKTIVYGGAAVGKSPMMPGAPDLDSKPEMVKALVAIVRGFAK